MPVDGTAALAELPAILMFAGLAAYSVLAGADFGAGIWTHFARGGRASVEATRDHARHAWASRRSSAGFIHVATAAPEEE